MGSSSVPALQPVKEGTETESCCGGTLLKVNLAAQPIIKSRFKSWTLKWPYLLDFTRLSRATTKTLWIFCDKMLLLQNGQDALYQNRWIKLVVSLI